MLLLRLLAYLPMVVLQIIAYKAYILLRLFAYRKSVIAENLNRSFPEKDTKEREAISQKFYVHFSKLLAEIIKSFGITKNQIQKRFSFKNEALIQRYYKQGKDVILVLGHYGNWEWGLLATSILSKHEMVGIYKPLSNQYWNEKIKALRSRFGASLVSMQESGRYLLKKGNKPRLIGIIADQTPSADELNYWTTFLRQETPVFMGTEKLAKKLNCPVVFVHIDRQNSGHYTMNFELITENPETHPEGEITNLHTQKLEEKIIARPELWLWSHRRWKHKRK